MGNSRKEMKDQVKNQDGLSTDTPMSRRKFLKKAGYAAPSLIVLGNLAKPVIAAGGSDTKDTGFGGYGGGSGGFGG